jgi:nucleoside recognition membrane protein YjiH
VYLLPPPARLQLMLLFLIMFGCSFRALDALSTFLCALSIWLQIVMGCHRDSVLVSHSISFDSTFIRVLHVVVALFRHCSCIFLVCTISGAPCRTILIGGQVSWSLCQENIGPHHLFDAFPFNFCLVILMGSIWGLLLGCPALCCLL